MKLDKTHYLTLLILLFTKISFGQLPDAPAMAMPTKSNIILVDRIIEVTKHKDYFIEYCTNKVKKYSIENNWTIERTSQVLESIEFENYSSVIYNSYADYTTSQLQTLLDALILIKNNPRIDFTMILTNSIMQSNLDLFVNKLIKGKYLQAK